MTPFPVLDVIAGLHSVGQLHIAGHVFSCRLGREGVIAAADKVEGDWATPLGNWPLRRLYYRPDRLDTPDTGLPVAPITPNLLWCDDPNHPSYNHPVLAPFSASHERMWRQDHRYDLVVVLGYNDAPVVPGKGSAIFLHLSESDGGPTAGCIALKPAHMAMILPGLGGKTILRVRQAP